MVVVQLTYGPWTKKFQDCFCYTKYSCSKIWQKYGIQATSTFIEFIKGKHNDIKLSDCRLFVEEALPYVGASPDRILLCSCCEKACMEIKCLYSINYTKQCYSNLEYLRLCDSKTMLKKSHKSYTQCATLQMAVTGTIKNHFVV